MRHIRSSMNDRVAMCFDLIASLDAYLMQVRRTIQCHATDFVCDKLVFSMMFVSISFYTVRLVLESEVNNLKC